MMSATVARLPAGGPAEVLFRRKRVDGWKVIDEKTSALGGPDRRFHGLCPGPRMHSSGLAPIAGFSV
jgi:hypothetical protein